MLKSIPRTESCTNHTVLLCVFLQPPEMACGCVSPTRYTFWKRLYYELAKANISKGTLPRGTEARREECTHRIKVLSSFPKQKNKQYSTANIQRTAHHVCLSCNNKSWDTAIAPGWLRMKPTLVLIKFGGRHTGLTLQKLSSQLAAILQRSEPVVNLNQWWMSLVEQHWQCHVLTSCIAPARGTNRFSAATAVNPELNATFSSRCLLWKPCHAYQQN